MSSVGRRRRYAKHPVSWIRDAEIVRMIPGVSSAAVGNRIQVSLERANQQLANTSLKLATLKRTTSASSDPAGMMAAQKLHNELSSLQAAMNSNDRTRSLVQVADTGLAHVSEQLNSLEANLVAAADGSLSSEARDALQIEIDSALDAINRIGGSTFSGQAVYSGQTRTFVTTGDVAQPASLTIPEVNESLGGTNGRLADLRSGGSASLQSGNVAQAQAIVSDVREQVNHARVTAGAFEKYSLDSAQRQLQDTAVQLQSSLSQIEDADVAAEASNLTRDMILADASRMTARLAMAGHKAASRLIDDLLRR